MQTLILTLALIRGSLEQLASDASKFVTGSIVNVDGGFGCFGGASHLPGLRNQTMELLNPVYYALTKHIKWQITDMLRVKRGLACCSDETLTFHFRFGQACERRKSHGEGVVGSPATAPTPGGGGWWW